MLHISIQGKILDINLIEENASSFLSHQSGLNIDAMRTNMIRELVCMVIPEYVSESLGTGQTWDCVDSVNTGLHKYVEMSQYMLTDYNSNYADLSLLSTIESERSEEYIELSGMKMKMNQSGTTFGTIRVNRNSGWVVASEWQKDLVTETVLESLPMSVPPLPSKEKITVKEI